MRHTHPFPRSRRIVVDTGRATRSRPSIHGLIEVDVTEARRLLAGRDGPSLTAWVTWCVARAAAEHPEVHAYRDLRGRIVTFDAVDVNLSVEVTLEGRSFPMNHVLRDAARRSPADLHAELQTVRRHPGDSPTARLAGRAKAFGRLPGFLRVAMLRLLHRLPDAQRRLAGTVGVTSVGMFGAGGGWGIAFQVHTLSVVVGGIALRPGYAGEVVEPREMLHLTLSFDHDIVDGAPAARFAAELRRILESAAGLEPDGRPGRRPASG